MDDKIRIQMLEAYYDGGVSFVQKAELGTKRPEINAFLTFASRYEGVPFRSLSSFGGLEFCFDYEKDFEKIGISGQILAQCMDAKTDAIRAICRRILEALNEARTLAKDGETHLMSRGVTINTTAVKAFILATLDAKERYQNNELIPELYFLLSQILFPGEPDADAVRASQDLKQNAALLAWAYHFKHGTYPSYRKLAQIFLVAPSTISRLFDSPDEMERLAGIYTSLSDDPASYPALKEIFPIL
jgi:hypothetical protein